MFREIALQHKSGGEAETEYDKFYKNSRQYRKGSPIEKGVDIARLANEHNRIS